MIDLIETALYLADKKAVENRKGRMVLITRKQVICALGLVVLASIGTTFLTVYFLKDFL